MIRLIDLDNSTHWDELVTSLPDHDIYYLSGYVKAFKQHGDGNPVLIWWEHEGITGACVLMMRDIANDKHFLQLEQERYFDAVTPYGYGGFIFSTEPTEEQLSVLSKEFIDILKQQDVISIFFRFHPILGNAKFSKNICEVIDLGKTISLDLKNADTIWSNITSKNRNMIRKAEKLGVDIHHGKGMELLARFKEIYDETMRRDNSEEYYFFNNDFYKSISEDLKYNYEVFYATFEDKIISMAIILFDNKQLHYHLSGSIREYRSYAPSNKLLYEVALWGAANGYTSFHLGGGVGSGDDPLYKFKAAFNRNSDNQFSIGKLIVDEYKYNELIKIRQNDTNFVESSCFFPKYRS